MKTNTLENLERLVISELRSILQKVPKFRTTVSDIRPIIGLLDGIGHISHTQGDQGISDVIIHGEYTSFDQAELAFDATLALNSILEESPEKLALHYITFNIDYVATAAEKVAIGQAKFKPLENYGHGTLMQSLDDAGIAYRENPDDIDSHQEISLFGNNAVLNPIGILEEIVGKYENSGNNDASYNLDNLKLGLLAARRGIIPIREYSRISQRTIIIDDWVRGTDEQINRYFASDGKNTEGMTTYPASEWTMIIKDFRN